MSEVDQTQSQDAEKQQLTLLKSRADMLGISYSNNISVETLRAKIEAKLDSDTAGATKQEKPVSASESRTLAMQEANKLIRCRVTCLDPKKRDLQGEVFTVGNEEVGTIRKMIPFGELTDEGFHIPNMIFNVMKNREFLQIREVKDRRTGETKIDKRWVREFALEVLPPLTQDELDELAVAQAAEGGA